MKKILFIAYYFPPIGGAGTQRTLKFVKYLPKYNWQSVILTVKNDVHHVHDQTLLGELPEKISIYRTRYFEPRHIYRRDTPTGTAHLAHPKKTVRSVIIHLITRIIKFLFFVDDLMFWLPFAYWRGLKIIKKNNIDVIFSTSPPETSHLIAYLLSKKAKIPMIADFRDEWTADPYRIYPTAMHKKINAYLEKKIVKQSTKIVTAAESISRDLIEKYTSTDEDKIITVTNGFDYAIAPAQKVKRDQFEILYAGSLSKTDGADNFLASIQLLIDKKKLDQNKIKIKFIGLTTLPKAKISGNIVEYIPYMPYPDIIKQIKNATLLLLIISTRRGTAAYSTKLFDYIASNRPILALVPPQGHAAQLIRETNTGYIIDPDNTQNISKKILELYHTWESNSLVIHPSVQIIQKYSREKLTGKLAQLLDQATNNS